MQAFVGLFLFSVLLTTGASLECETCTNAGNSCSGEKLQCTAGLDTCLTLVAEATTGGQTATSILKSCYSQAVCDQLKPGDVFQITGASAKIKEVTCKAPSPSASLLLALSGLLLLKVVF
ncbi:phospholipase A2 inhibitor and Ly6/PLAUR domain-containing protein-like [Heteronotia binoei]|uniref:phospholipase A2 inhibitor and Ly6/PLAUR domain-containing protein-like n=1 Tax=Heteronotia binoei TaxID=13085 RepID=UPI00292FAC6B|nr:phospholipase A2 inhibitor and Ly6/PLAUR domain-containing protein-like [Heteronotia binoei]